MTETISFKTGGWGSHVLQGSSKSMILNPFLSSRPDAGQLEDFPGTVCVVQVGCSSFRGMSDLKVLAVLRWLVLQGGRCWHLRSRGEMQNSFLAYIWGLHIFPCTYPPHILFSYLHVLTTASIYGISYTDNGRIQV